MMKHEKYVDEVIRLKQKRKAVLLAHNYQRPEIQDIADFVGDSLELSLCAAQTEAKTIVFCGVDFMAETAAILNPDKRVLIPDKNAVCPMAAMLPGELVDLYRERHPDARVVLYINTLAEAKARCDAVCTSANSAEIISRMDSEKVLFGPDWNLTQYAKNHTNKTVVSIPKFGFCPVHMLFNAEAISQLKASHPAAEVLAHPECSPEVCAVADFVGSTSKMYRRAVVSKAKEFIIATEVGLLHRLRKERPDVVFIPAYNEAICAHMKLHTLEKLHLSLRDMRFEIKVPPKITALARDAVEFMLGTKETLS
jgi:quinolinate synthase